MLGGGATTAGPASWTAGGPHLGVGGAAATAAAVAAAGLTTAGGELPAVTGRGGGGDGRAGHYLNSFAPAGLTAARMVAAVRKPLSDARHPCGHLTSDSRSISSASALSTLTTLPGTASSGRTPPSPHFLPAAQASHTSLATSKPARAGVVGAAAPDGGGAGSSGGAGHRLRRGAVRPSSSAPASTIWSPRGSADDLSDEESEASVCSFSGGASDTVVPGRYAVAGLCPADELELDVWPAATEPHVWLPLEKQC
ncbi:hypothetical protein MMPV_007594 [Pyropia vietnamensis]